MTQPEDELTEITAVWEGHENEEYRRDQSHWRGADRWGQEQWESIGESTWSRVHALYHTARRRYPEDDLPAMLEWGPGGGSNLHRFAPHASVMYGVDISAKNLEEASRVVAEQEGARFVPVLLDGEPESIRDEIQDPIDLFISTAVFQHFPSQEYGAKVLETVHDIMAPSGLAYVQIRLDNGNPKYVPKRISDYKKRHITANSYELSYFWDLLVGVGFRPLMIANVKTSNNYASFYFVKPK